MAEEESFSSFSDEEEVSSASVSIVSEQETLLEEMEPKNTRCMVWSMIGCCSFAILVCFIIGLLIVHVPWLGLFALISLLPSLCILWLVYWRNHREDAHLALVVKYLAIGMLGVMPLAMLEWFLVYLYDKLQDVYPTLPSLVEVFTLSFFQAFFMAALCEETFKYLVAFMIPVKPGRDSPYSVVVYSMAGALGLATLENMIYVVVVGFSGNLLITVFTAVTRAFMAVPLHATTGVIIGAHMAEKRYRVKEESFIRIMIVPYLLHGVYDFCSMFPSAFYVAYHESSIFFVTVCSIMCVIVGILYARRRAKAIREIHTWYDNVVTI